MTLNAFKEPKFGLLYGILLPVLVLPVIVIVWVSVRGDEADRYYRHGLAAAAAGNYSIALADFKRAGELGHAEAYCNLGLMYVNGMGCDDGLAPTGRDYLELAALNGSLTAEYELGVLAENDPAPDYELAALHYRRAALGGHIDGLNAMARLHENGLGVNQSSLLAAEFYEQAAATGSPEAQAGLGELYASGALGAPDMEEAHRWFSLAADQDWPRGFAGLGVVYEAGWGDNSPDPEQAERCYRQAVRLGDPVGMVNLGDLLKNEGNREEALAFYRQAAEQKNYAPAWHRLGVYYFNAMPPDYQEARRCFMYAAKSGSAASWINLGIMSELGQGGAVDPARAEVCYRMAEQLGHAEASERLAELRGAAKR